MTEFQDSVDYLRDSVDCLVTSSLDFSAEDAEQDFLPVAAAAVSTGTCIITNWSSPP
jgi:hypothetical protein